MNEAISELMSTAVEWAEICALQRDRVLEAAAVRTQADIVEVQTGESTTDADAWRLRFRADRHFLLNALHQLCKTLDMLHATGLPNVPIIAIKDEVRVHRAILEHWEEHAPGWFDPAKKRTRAGREYGKTYPGLYPWVDSYGTSGHVYIGQLEVQGLGPMISDLTTRLQALLGTDEAPESH